MNIPIMPDEDRRNALPHIPFLDNHRAVGSHRTIPGGRRAEDHARVVYYRHRWYLIATLCLVALLFLLMVLFPRPSSEAAPAPIGNSREAPSSPRK